jgi:hypothetical protein
VTTLDEAGEIDASQEDSKQCREQREPVDFVEDTSPALRQHEQELTIPSVGGTSDRTVSVVFWNVRTSERSRGISTT